MDKRMRRTIMTLHANGLSAEDIAKYLEARRERKEVILTTMTIEDVLKEMGAVDPTRRIPQKPMIQPDMPKRFVSISESRRKSKKHTMRKQRTVTAEQRQWHEMACGFAKNGQKLLKSQNYNKLLREIETFKKLGYEQIGNITADFYHEGDTYVAVMKKGDAPDAR